MKNFLTKAECNLGLELCLTVELSLTMSLVLFSILQVMLARHWNLTEQTFEKQSDSCVEGRVQRLQGKKLQPDGASSMVLMQWLAAFAVKMHQMESTVKRTPPI